VHVRLHNVGPVCCLAAVVMVGVLPGRSVEQRRRGLASSAEREGITRQPEPPTC